MKRDKLTLIPSVISTSIFKMPIGVIEDLEKIMMNFFKGFDKKNGRASVAMDVCCKLKEKGGLGIGRLTNKNKTSLTKWLWRFPHEPEEIWH